MHPFHALWAVKPHLTTFLTLALVCNPSLVPMPPDMP